MHIYTERESSRSTHLLLGTLYPAQQFAQAVQEDPEASEEDLKYADWKMRLVFELEIEARLFKTVLENPDSSVAELEAAVVRLPLGQHEDLRKALVLQIEARRLEVVEIAVDAAEASVNNLRNISQPLLAERTREGCLKEVCHRI